MTAVNLSGYVFGVLNGYPACEGQKSVAITIDFNLGSTWEFDFTTLQQQKTFTTVQTVFIDNSLNNQDVVVTINSTNQRFVVANNTCGYYTLIAPPSTIVTVVSTGLVLVNFQFLNFYIPPTIWTV